MIIKTINKNSEFISLRNEWDFLVLQASNPSIVQTWQWMKTWWDVYGKERKLKILCGYEGDHIIGIAPISIGIDLMRYYKIIKYKTVWFLGSGRTRSRGVVSDYLDFITEKGREKDFISGFLQYMSNDGDWDEIILENISAESNTTRLLEKFSEEYGLNFKIIDRTPSILIRLPESWDEYLKSISGSLRYKINRGRKEFSKLGGTYHLVKEENELSQAVADLERLHQHRWKSKGKEGAFSSHEWKTFHQKLIPLMFHKGRLKLSFLKLHGQVVAVNYNFAFDQKIHFFQSGLIPHQNKHIKLGLLLHSYCIEEAINEGFREYDFLKIGASGPGYKEIWGNFSRNLLTIRISRRSNKEKIYCFLNGIISLGRKIKDKIQLKSN